MRRNCTKCGEICFCDFTKHISTDGGMRLHSRLLTKKK